jgi:DNA-binding FadR family transcriptional regulator
MASAPQTIRQQITNQIRNDLVSGTFPAGTTLRESEMANRLGVSRGPVRDAFIQLSHEGILAYWLTRGTRTTGKPTKNTQTFSQRSRRRTVARPLLRSKRISNS